MGTEADAANNETGADEGVNPDTLYDDKGEEQGGEESTGNEAEGEEVEGGEEAGEESEGEEGKEGEEGDKGDGEEDEYVVPEKYDLTIAKDSLLDQTDIDRISADAKEKGLSNEDAQLVADMEAEAIDRYHGKLDKQVENLQAGWLKDAEADKEIGGEAFKENAELSKRLMDLLDESKYGNHPEVVRIFSKIGKLMSDDEAIFPKAHEKGEKTMEETFYPGTNK
jgi:hypothetical protein